MRYVILSVASDAEAERLIQDLTEHPGEPLRTPHWSNAVHATLATDIPAAAPRSARDVPVLRSA